MADGYFERGEIYGIRMDTGVGSEEGSYRPGLIVSSNQGNTASPTVNVLLTTTRPRANSISMEITATGRRSWILGNQIMTVDKTRLGEFMCSLSKNEMNRIDSILERVLDLGYVDDTAVKEKEREIAVLNAEKAELQKEIRAKEDKSDSYEIEIAMWKRLYEKALNMIVDMKVSNDITMRQAREPEKKVEVLPKVEEPEPVDINSCSFSDLRKLGFSSNIALTIINGRPYKKVADLKRVQGITSIMYKLVEKKICCVPVSVVETQPNTEEPAQNDQNSAESVPSEKVNINTATWKELVEKTGMSADAAYAITGYRKVNGPYKDVSDILKAKRIKQSHLDRFGSMMEV